MTMDTQQEKRVVESTNMSQTQEEQQPQRSSGRFRVQYDIRKKSSSSDNSNRSFSNASTSCTETCCSTTLDLERTGSASSSSGCSWNISLARLDSFSTGTSYAGRSRTRTSSVVRPEHNQQHQQQSQYKLQQQQQQQKPMFILPDYDEGIVATRQVRWDHDDEENDVGDENDYNTLIRGSIKSASSASLSNFSAKSISSSRTSLTPKAKRCSMSEMLVGSSEVDQSRPTPPIRKKSHTMNPITHKSMSRPSIRLDELDDSSWNSVCGTRKNTASSLNDSEYSTSNSTYTSPVVQRKCAQTPQSGTPSSHTSLVIVGANHLLVSPAFDNASAGTDILLGTLRNTRLPSPPTPPQSAFNWLYHNSSMNYDYDDNNSKCERTKRRSKLGASTDHHPYWFQSILRLRIFPIVFTVCVLALGTMIISTFQQSTIFAPTRNAVGGIIDEHHVIVDDTRRLGNNWIISNGVQYPSTRVSLRRATVRSTNDIGQMKSQIVVAQTQNDIRDNQSIKNKTTTEVEDVVSTMKSVSRGTLRKSGKLLSSPSRTSRMHSSTDMDEKKRLKLRVLENIE